MKHKHYDVILKWIKDTSKPIQYYDEAYGEWRDCIYTPEFIETIEYRIKPRSFVVGAFYPIIYKGSGCAKYRRDVFKFIGADGDEQFLYDCEWVGEKIDIKWG